MSLQDKTREQLFRELEECRAKMAQIESHVQELDEAGGAASENLPRLSEQYSSVPALASQGTLESGDSMPYGQAKKQASFLSRILEKAADGISMCHNIREFPYVRFTHWNPRMTEITGFTMEEINESGWYQTVYPDPEVQRRAVERMASMREGNDIRAEEWVITAKNGTERTLSISTSVLEEVGSEVHVLALMQDISERNKLQAAFRESEQLFRLAFENASVGVCLVDTQGRLMRVNNQMCEMLGYSRSEFEAMTVHDIAHPEDVEYGRRFIESALSGETGPADFEKRYIHKEGHVVWGRVSSSLVRDGEGKPLYFISHVQDITHRKKAKEALSRSEDKYRLLTENSLTGIFIHQDDVVVFANQRLGDMLGYTKEEMIGRNFFDGLHPDDREMVRARVQARLRGELSSMTHRLRLLKKTGEAVWCDILATRVDYQGRPAVMGNLADITERKNAEEALRESEERYRTLMAIIPDAVLVDVAGSCVYANEAAARIFGLGSPDAFIGKTPADVVHPESLERVRRELEMLYKDQIPGPLGQEKFVRPDGSLFYGESAATPAIFQGKPAVLIVIRDTTERKLAEEALRQSEAKYRFLAENVRDVLWTVDLNMRATYVSPSIEKVLGYTAEDRLQQHVSDHLTPKSLAEAQQKLVAELSRCTEEGILPDGPIILNLEYVHKNGSIVCLESALSFIRDETGTPIGIHGLSRDITEKKRAEQALRESEEFNRRLVEHAPLGIAYVDGEGILQYVNPAAKRIAGIPEDQTSVLLGRNILKLPGLQERQRFQGALHRVLQGESFSEFEVPYVSSVGFETVLFGGATPRFGPDKAVTGAILMFADISERKRAEEIQRQAVRFRAVADLAGGVAHNFNNLLQIVIGHLELALMDLDLGNYSEVKDGLERVLEGAKSGAETVRRLQSFAGIRDRSKVSEEGVFDLSGVVRQALEMSKTWWKSTPEKQGIKVDLTAELQDGCLVLAEKSELFEVLVNLMKNAAEALPEGGSIGVETRVEEDRVVFQIKDSGIGITEENLKRVFNPFFTTKATTGSGLGLASSRKIIEDCGGSIFVESSERKGTTFTIRLPLAEKPSGQMVPQAQQVSGQEKTILLIDDVEAVLGVLKTGLTRSGHVVVTASSGQQGLDIFKDNPFDLVICDLGMPGINGWEIGKIIRTLCEERGVPKTPFILLTGWGGQKAEAAKIAESGVDVVIEKPANMGKIREIIRELIERESSSVSH
jgi:PAS domain S-box-containing protein